MLLSVNGIIDEAIVFVKNYKISKQKGEQNNVQKNEEEKIYTSTVRIKA